MQHADVHVAELEFIAISKGPEGKMRIGRFVKIDRGTGLGRKFAAAREMVGLDVRFDDVRGPHLCRFTCLEILIDVLLWIHHSATALTPSPEEVRGAARVRLDKLPENHLFLPFLTTVAEKAPFEANSGLSLGYRSNQY